MISIVYTGSVLSGITSNLEKLKEIIEQNSNGQVRFEFIIEKAKKYDVIGFKSSPFFLDGLSPAVRGKEIKLLRPPLADGCSMCRHPNLERRKNVKKNLRNSRESLYIKSDGIVFVVDSLPYYVDESLTAWKEMQTFLSFKEKSFSKYTQHPLVIQYNKRDMSNAIDIKTLKNSFNPHSEFPEFQASAFTGEGVLETFLMILDLIEEQLNKCDGSGKSYP